MNYFSSPSFHNVLFRNRKTLMLFSSHIFKTIANKVAVSIYSLCEYSFLFYLDKYLEMGLLEYAIMFIKNAKLFLEWLCHLHSCFDVWVLVAPHFNLHVVLSIFFCYRFLWFEGVMFHKVTRSEWSHWL